METNWKILNTKRKPDNGLVVKVNYVINFKLENQEDRLVSSVDLIDNEIGDSFIPYEDLTEEILLNWVKEKLGEEKILELENNFENRLQEKIDRHNNPEYLSGLPFSSK